MGKPTATPQPSGTVITGDQIFVPLRATWHGRRWTTLFLTLLAGGFVGLCVGTFTDSQPTFYISIALMCTSVALSSYRPRADITLTPTRFRMRRLLDPDIDLPLGVCVACTAKLTPRGGNGTGRRHAALEFSLAGDEHVLVEAFRTKQLGDLTWIARQVQAQLNPEKVGTEADVPAELSRAVRKARHGEVTSAQ